MRNNDAQDSEPGEHKGYVEVQRVRVHEHVQLLASTHEKCTDAWVHSPGYFDARLLGCRTGTCSTLQPQQVPT